VITRFEHGNVQWVDVERPTVEEVDALTEEFDLGPQAAQEMLSPTAKPRVDLYAPFLYIVLHFPASRGSGGGSPDHEVDIIVGKNFIITVHYETVTALHDFARSFETAMLLKRVRGTFHSGHIIFEIAQRLYQSVENELESVEDSVTAIERSIFDGKEKKMVRPLSNLTRELLNHKRIIGNQADTLKELEAAGTTLFGAEFRAYMTRITALHYRVYSRALMLMDTLSELRNTNDSLLTTRQNEIMKNLTIMAFVTFPLTLISSIFGMNVDSFPIVGQPNDFWIIISFMAIIAVTFFMYFKLKHWF
jgi:magnesium transporter